MKNRKIKKPQVKNRNKYYQSILNEQMARIKNLKKETHAYRFFHNSSTEDKIDHILLDCIKKMKKDNYKYSIYGDNYDIHIENYLRQAILKELKIFLKNKNLFVNKTNPHYAMVSTQHKESDLDDLRLKIEMPEYLK